MSAMLPLDLDTAQGTCKMKDDVDSPSTEIARLEAELARSREIEQRAWELIETAPDGIVVVDQAGNIVLVNAQTEKLFGYQRDELVGKAIEILVPVRAQAAHIGMRGGFIANPAVRPMGSGLDLTGRRKDGSELPVEISLSPLHTDDGVLVSASIRDITERREVQRALREARNELEQRVQQRTGELERANRALQTETADRNEAERKLHQAQKMEAVGQLTGGVAHDFNNLLTVVMGNLQLLARHLRNDPLADELIKGAMKAARRGADLNRTLLAFSRKQRLAPVPLDFNEMISSMAPLLRRALGEQVQINVVEAPDLPLATADVTQLETALLNLAVNSRDAMPIGGTLTIETAAVQLDEHYASLEIDVTPGRYVMLAVSDTGTGMTDEVASHAFEPFFTTKETGKGSGLGLAMVYGFVKQSGGHVKLYSEPGIGTTVKLFLPEILEPAEASTEAPEAESAQPVGRETILVVEDEEDVRDLVCRLLTALGYRVLTAAEGKSALALLDAEPGVALLFTDVVLPGGMNGPDIARAAQAKRSDLKVIYTSGYTGNAIQQLEALGADVKLLSKPYAIEDLAQTVRDALDG